MPGEPSNYTDIGGGGKLPPHGEDYFSRIKNVHWPKKRVSATGGVFIAGANDSNIYYINVNAGGETNPETGAPVWQSLGTLGFYETRDVGPVQGSAYGLVNGENPVFVLVGGGGAVDAVGVILASQDGLNWSRVFTYAATNPASSQGANMFGVVWDGSAFWAGGHQFNNFFDDPISTNWYRSETDVLFTSSNGFSWSQVGSYEIKIQNTDHGWPPWPDYTTGLLAAHCSDTVFDGNGNGVPGGIFGYNDDSKILIAPIDPAAINYLNGDSRVPDGSNAVVVRNLGAGSSVGSSPNIPVICVANAGNAWVAAGGVFGGESGGSCAASILVQSSTTTTGFDWVVNSPGGSKAIITLCGGQIKPPTISGATP